MTLPLLPAFGQLPAQNYNDVVTSVNNQTGVQQTGSTLSSSSVGTTMTALLTITGFVMAPGTAYSIENVGGVLGSTTIEVDFGLFKTSTATQIGAFYRTPAIAGGAIRSCYGKVYIRNTAATALTFDLILGGAASSGTFTHEAASNRPRQFIARPVGLASAYTNAFIVT